MPHMSGGKAGGRMLPRTIGTHRAWLFACLAAFILATLVTAVAMAQSTGPTTSIFLDGEHGNSGWFRSDVRVTLNVTDSGGLGINRTEYNFNGSESGWRLYTGPFNITKEEMTAVYYRSIDNGSQVEPTKLTLISIDKTPPTLTYVLTPAPNANGWSTQDTQLHYEASDAVSGVANRPADMTLSNEGVYTGLTGTATDNAGNAVTITVPTLGIDRTPPVVGNLTVQSNAYVGDYLPVSAYVVEANPERMEWDFGDGTGTAATVNDNVARTSHAYKQPGSYRITLIVADKAGQSTKSAATVTIYGTTPTAKSTATPTPGPAATPTPVPLPSPTVTPKPAPAPSFMLACLALIGGALVLAAARKK
jgi:hypothetical protein